ncbi:MAG: hypothetical protein IPL87_01635 [Candidatus Moraniibacteriota bacterium]|nr:MAG: hypothetical protein IPL87_01635 [Candidatus Moranbacteria bacterium]
MPQKEIIAYRHVSQKNARLANTEEADAEEEFLRGVELTGEETSLLASDFLM